MTLDTAKAADTLLRDHAAKRDFVPYARDWGVANLADAYAVQKAFVARLAAAEGGRAGYKIGLTSQRMQQMAGVDHPIIGVVMGRRVWPSGTELVAASYGRVGIEFEICVCLARDLPPRGQPYTYDEVAEAVEAVCPAFEIVDDRNSPYPLDLLTLLADNSWNEGVVTGEWRTTWPDLAAVRGVAEVNGRPLEQGEGHGRDVLGHPFNPLVWLANHLNAEGAMLHKGEIVSTGSLVTTRFPKAGERYRFTVEGLGAVEVGFR